MSERYPVAAYLAGAAFVRTGDEMAGPAVLLAGLALTGSSSSASFVLAGLTFSAVVGGPVLGALLDRSAAPGRVLCAALALHGAGLLTTLAMLGGGVPVAVTVAAATVAGLSGSALSAGWSSQLARVADGAMLRRAHAWDAMTFDGAGLAGPVLAFACTALLGAPAAVVVAVALVTAALPSAWRMPRRGRPSVSAPRPAHAGSVLAGSVEGARAIVGSRSLARATLTSVGSSMAQGMLVACVPALGEQAFGEADYGSCCCRASPARPWWSTASWRVAVRA